MSDDRYRLCKVILLAMLVVGGLIIGFGWSENGRYVQYDHSRNYSPDGTKRHPEPHSMFDSRTGKRIQLR